MSFSKQTEDLIADFRQLPRLVTDSSQQAPVRMDHLLEIVKDRYDLEKPSREQTIVENWNVVFGSLAGRCRPVSLKGDRTLVVSVANQTLRSELQFRKRSLLKKLQALPDCHDIAELVIRS